MRDLYQKWGFYKPVLTLDGQYTDVPCGDIDVDRLLAGKPAFLDLSAESEVLKKRKLVLGDLFGPNDVLDAPVKLNYLVALRQLIEAGFEVYQFQHGEPVQLTAWSVSSVFDFNPLRKQVKEDVALRRRFIREMSLAYDDVAILNASVVSELSKTIKDPVVWTSDFLCTGAMLADESRLMVVDDASVDERDVLVEKCWRCLSVHRDDVAMSLSDQQPVLPFIELLSFCWQFPEAAFSQYFPHTPNLRALNVHVVEKTTLSSLRDALSMHTAAMPYLTTIELRRLADGVGLNDLISFLHNVPSIKRVSHPLACIDLKDTDIDEMALRKLLQGARSLQELELNKPEHVAIFFELLEAGKINLNKLNGFSLPHHALTIEQVALIMENLVDNDFQFHILRNDMPSQIDLIVEYDVFVDPDSFEDQEKKWTPTIYPSRISPHDISVLKEMPIFTHIELWLFNPDGEDKISVDHVLNLIAKMPNLKSIKLQSYPSFMVNGRAGLNELAVILRERGLTVEDRDIEERDRQFAAKLEEERRLQNQYHTQLSVSLHDAQAQVMDADTAPKKSQFNLNRIFFSVSGAHPDPRDYRLTAYDSVIINEADCDASEAFSLSNEADLKLKSTPVSISAEDVYSECIRLKKTSPAAEYYYAKTKLILSSQWRALPSLNPNEIIKQLHINPSAEIDIQYSSRDNLYYVKSKADSEKVVEIDYIVEVPPVSARPSRAIQTLVDFCQKFESRALEMLQENPTGQDFLDALIQQGVGACRHRSLVFKALFDDAALRAKTPELNQLDFRGMQARIINNDCHSYVEIKEGDGPWIKCDLGGYDAALKIDDTADPLKNRDNLQKAVDAKLSVVIPSPPVRDYFPDPKTSVEKNPKSYAQHLIAKAESKRLIECMPEQLDGLSDVLQQTCHSTSKPFHYIHCASDLILNRPHVTLQEDNTGVIEQGHYGPVFRFLSEAHESRVLIVNFSQFSASELVRFNSLLDEKPSIDGVPLLPGTKVIGLIDRMKEVDASLYSRFRRAVEICPIEAKDFVISPIFTEPAAALSAMPLTIEFYGGLNWRAKLLGYWSLRERGLIYVKGALVDAIEQGMPISTIILNNPPLHDPDFTRFFKEANVRGYIEYEGRRLGWPKPELVTTAELTFAVEKIELMQKGAPNASAKMINPALFSLFFKQYEARQNQLIEKSGILDSLTPPKKLTLYVSENLSAAQWAQLLAECRVKEIMLTVTLAPHVTLPAQLAEKLPVVNAVPSAPRILHDYFIVAADPDLSVSRPSKENTLVIDVSELNSSDLLIKTSGEFRADQAELAFSQCDGALKTALLENKNIILHGKLSAEMRQRLQAFLFERQQAGKISGRIIIVSDSKTAPYFEPFMRVFSDDCKQDSPYVQKQALDRNRLGFVGLTSDLPPYRIAADMNLSKEAASEFHRARLESVQHTLHQSHFVFLAGLTGVGKTTFIDNVWKHNHPALHIGFEKIMAWAQDKSAGLKTLFIDEANITSKNWSQFEGLFTNDPPGMMIGNRYVELSKDHKVIFAGNPVKYSDDRQLPSLFARHGNSVVFEPLSPACIYQDVLLPIFNHEDTERSKAIANPILAVYQYLNSISATEVLLTPRELKMMAQLAMGSPDFAKYYAYQLARPFVPKDKRTAFDANFKVERPESVAITLPSKSTLTLTGSNRPTAEMLFDFLKWRESSTKPAGLGGLLIEGEPGLGKSELVNDCLRAQNFMRRELGDKKPLLPDKQYFYYLPAGALPSLQREMLIRAFDEGAVVVFDEFNTAASHEGLLNRLLMGQGPNGEAPKKPGFMLIGTQNPAQTSAGRTKTSSALLHRMHYHVMPPYTPAEMKHVLHEMGLPENRIDAIVNQYLAKKQKNPALCFRDVIHAARDDVRGLLGGHEHPTKDDLLVLLKNSNLNPDQLEAICLHKLCDDDLKREIAFHPQVSETLLNKLVTGVIDVSTLNVIASKAENVGVFKEIFKKELDQATLHVIAKKTDDLTILAGIIAKTNNPDTLKIIFDKVKSVEIAKQIVEKCNEFVSEWQDRSRHSPSFFSNILTKTHAVSIVATLYLIQQQYQGAHKNNLEKLIDRCNGKDAVGIIQDIKALIDSGDIGQPVGSERLRAALQLLVDNVEKNQPIDVAHIEQCVSDKTVRWFRASRSQ